jgi:5-methylcytosine-specific restriction endonuclease McrA
MGKWVDITNQRFGRLTAVKTVPPPEHIKSNLDTKYWLCRCDCGEEKIVRGTFLRSGSIKSCGCLNKDKCNKKSWVGKRFGNLNIISVAEDYVSPKGRKGIQYLCQCSCGRRVVIRRSTLLGGATQCKFCARSQEVVDLTGKVFGELVVIKRTANREFSSGRSVVAWLCRCSCGNSIEVTGTNLQSGSTRSCGCKSIEWRSGENNGSWKGGITPVYTKLRNGVKNQQWKEAVMDRDNYTCQCCGDASGGNLNVHHIFPFGKILEKFNITTQQEGENCRKMWDISNGITLCETCHKAFHSEFGFTFSEENFWAWLKLNKEVRDV